MKRLHLKSRVRRELLLISLPTLALAGFAWYSTQLSPKRVETNITPFLIGKWKVETPLDPWMRKEDWNDEDGAMDVVFRADGTYEQVVGGNVMPGARASYFWVWKGRYSVNGNRVSMLPTATRFSRPRRVDEGLDQLFVPCSDSIGCATDWEMFNSDKDEMKKSEPFKPLQPDWKRGIFRSEFVTQAGGSQPRTIRKTWTKQP